MRRVDYSFFQKCWDYRYIPFTESGSVAKRQTLYERSALVEKLTPTRQPLPSSQKGKKKSRYRWFFSQPRLKWVVRGERMEVNKLIRIDWYRPKTIQGILAKKDAMFEREKILSGPARTQWANNHRKTNLNFRLRENLSSRMRAAVKNNAKASKAANLLGCSIESFKLYLESKFEPGMSWDNYGPVWHIDHIMPCAIFNLSNPEHQKRCFHFSNLQPLFARDNMRKSAKVTPQELAKFAEATH